jgi:hypothetical protein
MAAHPASGHRDGHPSLVQKAPTGIAAPVAQDIAKNRPPQTLAQAVAPTHFSRPSSATPA